MRDVGRAVAGLRRVTGVDTLSGMVAVAESAATFAFVERITTVRLTPELLTGATFLYGYVGPVSTAG